MTLRTAVTQGTDLLTASGTPEPRLTAELLLCHAVHCERVYLYAHPEQELREVEWIHYGRWLHERMRGKPLQYITKVQEFYGRPFIVSPDVLIPRPETELLVETVIRRRPDARVIVDVGVGSGAIAVTLALELNATVIATDISPAALKIAQKNATALSPVLPAPTRSAAHAATPSATPAAETAPTAPHSAVSVTTASTERPSPPLIGASDAATFAPPPGVAMLSPSRAAASHTEMPPPSSPAAPAAKSFRALSATMDSIGRPSRPHTGAPDSAMLSTSRAAALDMAGLPQTISEPTLAPTARPNPAASCSLVPDAPPLARIKFIAADLLSAIADGAADVVVSNPPYIAAGDRESLQREVRDWEPKLALFAGPSGLDVYRRLLPEAWRALRPGGLLALELGLGQADAVTALLTNWRNVEITPDLAGIPRVLSCEKPS